MLIPIKKIIVRDRIRKDFGDINELAMDIQDNGLINPVVVNKEYVLLAGERRLRACKQLGIEQIEVRMMDTRDAEHELNIEISENDVRKDFSKAERVDYMYRLMRIEKEKATERQRAGVPLKSAEGGEAAVITAKQFGIGKDTMRKEMQIVENRDLLTPEDFADWDEGKLSTNKAFQRIKKKLEEKEEEAKQKSGLLAELDCRLREYETVNKKLRADNKTLANRAKPEPIYLEPEDYQEVKNNLEHAEDTIERRDAEIANLKQQLREAANMDGTTLYEYALDDMVQFINRYSELEEIAPVIEAMKEVMA